MGKYDPLRDLLASRQLDEVVLTFGEVEKLVGPLPPSAHVHRAWWANGSKVQSLAWRSAGWHVAAVDQAAQRVTFARGTVGGSLQAKRSARPTVVGVPISRRDPDGQETSSGMTEEVVQGRLVAYLVKDGWQILRVAQTATRERGTDVLAARDGRTLAVEVKGYPSLSYADPRRAGEVKPTQPATQARHWYAGFRSAGQLTFDMRHPSCSICGHLNVRFAARRRTGGLPRRGRARPRGARCSPA